MKKETKHIIRTLGTILFILYVLALIYFLFFSEEYGRAAMEERQYRYNLIPFVEIRRFWVYRKQLGFMAVPSIDFSPSCCASLFFANAYLYLFAINFSPQVIADKKKQISKSCPCCIQYHIIHVKASNLCNKLDDLYRNTKPKSCQYDQPSAFIVPENKNTKPNSKRQVITSPNKKFSFSCIFKFPVIRRFTYD